MIRSTLQGVDSILNETLDASRSLTAELCPPVLHQSGLAAALTWLAARLREKQAFRVQVRTTADELRRAADVIAERLGRARGPWTFLVPLRGWSSLDAPGRPIHDPAADAAFVARLKERLADPGRVREVDLHLYSKEFARVAVDELVRLYREATPHAVA